MLPLIAFSAASVVPCAGDTSGPRLLIPWRRIWQEHGRVATYSTSSTGTGASAASAIYEMRERPALPYLKPQLR
ncbi:hypothetical protein JB92DRAFT_2905747 [Gautieria morchelliformis]|nr:hypothetical protein JB92DRAFT_2905747 [Gautieria morchelliformis]